METYICPNDRQLALRARLGTGWSSRGQLAQRRRGQPLSTEEEEQILRVLKRNEALAEHERVRVESMLQRLDRLKQSTSAKSNEECSLCHREFGRISNLPNMCVDCGRCVCNACCTEVKINPGNKPQIKKRSSLLNLSWIPSLSSANSPSQTPKHDNFVSLSRPPSSVDSNGKTQDSTYHSIGTTSLASTPTPSTSSTPHGRRASFMGGLSSAAAQSQQLLQKVKARANTGYFESRSSVCKLCWEAREIWKRSGAWFYKTVPRSRMTSCPSSPSYKPSHGEYQNITSPTDLVGPSPFQTDDDTEQWVQLHSKRRPSKPEGSEETATCTAATGSKVTSPKENKETSPFVDLSYQSQTSASPKEKLQATSPTVPNSASNSDFQRISTATQLIESCSPNSNTTTAAAASITTTTNNNNINNNNWKTKQQPSISNFSFHPAYTNSKSHMQSTASALASSFTSINSNQKVASLTGEPEPGSAFVASASQLPRRSTKGTDEAPFGIIYFTLYHDTLNKQLHVAIHKAKNLIAMDANGLSDPYVVCELLPSTHNSPRPRTSTRPQCLNPVWNEALTFEPFDGKNIQMKTLRLAVLDEDLYGSDWLGEYRLPLGQLTPDRLTDFSVPLGPRKPVHRGEYDLACPTRGKIQLGLGYLEDRKQLCVEVIRCANLAPMDPNGFSDPFVKLYLRPDKTKKTKQKTQIKKATLFPEFHEKFYYDLNASEAGSRTLEVTVWDFDRGPSNDFIGGLTLGAGAKAERRELWLAVFRPPYRRIEAWFQLSNRTENGNQFSTPGVCD